MYWIVKQLPYLHDLQLHINGRKFVSIYLKYLALVYCSISQWLNDSHAPRNYRTFTYIYPIHIYPIHIYPYPFHLYPIQTTNIGPKIHIHICTNIYHTFTIHLPTFSPRMIKSCGLHRRWDKILSPSFLRSFRSPRQSCSLLWSGLLDIGGSRSPRRIWI